MNKPPFNSSTPPSASRQEGRLDSWKKIAAYLKRDVSTVQRWERREAMPVHRHVHEKLGSVYAFRSELDAWWGSRRLTTPLVGVTRAAEAIASGDPRLMQKAGLEAELGRLERLRRGHQPTYRDGIARRIDEAKRIQTMERAVGKPR